MPWVCIKLADSDLFSPFLIFACLSILISIIDLLLPYDTLGKDLDKLDDDIV